MEVYKIKDTRSTTVYLIPLREIKRIGASFQNDEYWITLFDICIFITKDVYLFLESKLSPQDLTKGIK